MRAISVNGTSNSGKTTVSMAIIQGLRHRGYRVGSVKEIHHKNFTIDPDANADTRLHKAAGSQLVTARALRETDILHQYKLPIEEILRCYDHDFVILEGVDDCNVPRIITAHNEGEIAERVDCRAIAVSGVFANANSGKILGMPIFNVRKDAEALVDFVEKRAFEPLPSFDADCCSQCGYSCREMAGMIAWQKASRDDCVLCAQGTELIIDGEPVPMVPFVQNILKNAVLGIAKELRGFKDNGTFEIRFKI